MSIDPATWVSLRRATLAEVPQVANLIAMAFDPLELTRWLVPEPDVRRVVMPAYFQAFVEHAAVYGTVDLTDDLTAAAVWLPAATADVPPMTDTDRQLVDICGRHLDRFTALHEAMDQAHPPFPAHEHLMFLAVHPDHQGRQLGTALLDRHHAILDRAGRHAFLEAASPDSARLYRRHWYGATQAPYRIHVDCPARMFPMWREPERRGLERSVA